ncbi:MAG TPA: HlyD family type I secretion periplasmic adaptor subunit [Parvularcula sp.]|nr:HlyD family type I secretion periplasmic adaptor subunit [Parvularcula sp.]HBS32778.1 HlyD family type I secretion periplasmic adaptor subunit [Parvularcula sp.]HBS33997.1 HlyD family type I secretion periplasmic adaptor subunit [Parvularcula sp.]
MLKRPEADSPAIDDAGRFSRIGLITVAAVFGGLLLWSILAPINSAVIAPGRISVETNRKAIQHLEGGVISEILVREGEAVAAGDVLIRLDAVVPKANAALLSEQLAERIARQARLLAERDGLSEIPADSRAFRLAPDDLDYSAQLEGQKNLLAAREQTKATQVSLLEERIVQSGTRIDGANTQIRSLKAQGKLIADELEGVKRLYAEGFAPLTRVRELEREKEAISGRQGALVASVAESQSVISEARLEIERLKQKSREDAIKEAEEVEVEIAGLIERRIAALDALRRTEIRAPEAGVVLGLAVHTKGGVIAPGAPVMEIVPKSSAGLLVAAQIAPRDVDKVRAGQEAVLRFSAFNARTTPEATGVVRHVSADNIVDKATGQPYFLVLIDLPPEAELDRILKNQALVPGMPVESFIKTGARPAISYLLKPLTDALSRSMREE